MFDAMSWRTGIARPFYHWEAFFLYPAVPIEKSFGAF
jgi:hypothetical protein